MKAVLDLYDRVVDRELLIRRVNITACDLIPEDAIPEARPVQLDMFTDYEAVERAEEALRSAEERGAQAATGDAGHTGKIREERDAQGDEPDGGRHDHGAKRPDRRAQGG